MRPIELRTEGEALLAFDHSSDDPTIIDISFVAGSNSCVLVGETERYEFETRAAAIAFALKAAQERSSRGSSVSINIEGGDHVWRLFDPNMRPRT